jgi:ring-1,2-phenylacetyl-CoA epoxidase subunit PaaB
VQRPADRPPPQRTGRRRLGAYGRDRARREESLEDSVVERGVIQCGVIGDSVVERGVIEHRVIQGRVMTHDWPLYEVFVRGKRGLNHVHVGSLHAADDEMAIHHARDLYTRRNEGVSIWVVKAADITASSPDEKDPFFAPSGDKVYRHPTFYDIPDNVPHM